MHRSLEQNSPEINPSISGQLIYNKGVEEYIIILKWDINAELWLNI